MHFARRIPRVDTEMMNISVPSPVNTILWVNIGKIIPGCPRHYVRQTTEAEVSREMKRSRDNSGEVERAGKRRIPKALTRSGDHPGSSLRLVMKTRTNNHGENVFSRILAYLPNG